MSLKAARIDESKWEYYKEEITALYSSPGGSLPKTMRIMKERHGFQATKSQYTTKLKKDWKLQKYANASIWAFADQRQRKRKLLENKDTAFSIHGIKKSRSDTDREIARNVTHTSRLLLLEDIPTPEGVQVFTPNAEVSSASVILRDVFIDNLPLFQIQRGIEGLILQIMKHPKPQPLSIFNVLGRPSNQLNALNNLQSGVDILKMALGDTVQWKKSGEGGALPCFILIPSPKRISLTSYFSPNNTSNNVPTFDMPGIPRQLIALQHFLQYFIVLTNNDVLDQMRIFHAVDWMLKNIKASLFSYLFSLDSIAVRIFMRKIFPAVVNSGNTKVAKEIIDRKIALTSPQIYLLPTDECMSIAVQNGDSRMVELLCKAGFPPQICSTGCKISKAYLPWETGKLDVLQMLLYFGANPDSLVKERYRGFPLVDAAKAGSLEAVEMLIAAGSEPNVYVPSHFGSPLQAAVNSENLEVAEYLIRSGADVNTPYSIQHYIPIYKLGVSQHMNESEACALKTPIQIACERNNITLVEILLAHGALIDLCPLSEVNIGNPMAAMCYPQPDTDRHDPVDYFPKYENMRFQTALQYTVQNRNLFLVRRLLSKGANPDSRVIPNQGDTPLQMSIRLNDPEISQILIETGADINAAPGRANGRTAIQAAAESGNIQNAQILLNRNANINASAGYERGLTALQAALRHGHPLMAELLLMSGANINAPRARRAGLTAIEAVAEGGNLNMIESLMHQGARLDSATAEAAILAAISHKNLPTLKFLVKLAGGTHNESKDDKTIPPIVAAAKAGWADGVYHLLKTGAYINSFYYDDREKDNFRALNWAIKNEDMKMIELLLESGASLQSPFSKAPYNDALCHAICRNSSKIVFLFLDKYNPPGSISFNPSALACAVEYIGKETTIFNTILSAISKLPKVLYDIQVRVAWNKLAKALESIDENSAIEATKSLLRAGAEINSKTTHEVPKVGAEIDSKPIFFSATLLQVAMSCGYIHVASFLLEQGAEMQNPGSDVVGTPLQEAIKADEIEFAYLLLQHDAEVNAPPADNMGVTALQAAVRNGHKDLALNLLEQGADVNAPAAKNGGVTALQAVAIHGYLDIAIELLRYDAHVTAAAASLNGRTAIDGAAEHGQENMLQLLLNHYDGDEDLMDVCERAAGVAEKKGHVEIASWLREYPGGSNESPH